MITTLKKINNRVFPPKFFHRPFCLKRFVYLLSLNAACNVWMLLIFNTCSLAVPFACISNI